MIPIPESAGEALTNRSYAHRFFLQAIYLNFAARNCCSAVIVSADACRVQSSAWRYKIGSAVASGTNRLRYLEVTVCRSEVEQAGDRNLGVCARGDMPVGAVANYQISRGTTPIRMSMKKAF